MCLNITQIQDIFLWETTVYCILRYSMYVLYSTVYVQTVQYFLRHLGSADSAERLRAKEAFEKEEDQATLL